MEILPNEIESIIHAYRIEFERVENEITRALCIYYDVESRASELINIIRTMSLSEYYGKTATQTLGDITEECKKLISVIITEQTITPVQQKMLSHLSKQIDYDHVFQIMFHPLCTLNLF